MWTFRKMNSLQSSDGMPLRLMAQIRVRSFCFVLKRPHTSHHGHLIGWWLIFNFSRLTDAVVNYHAINTSCAGLSHFILHPEILLTPFNINLWRFVFLSHVPVFTSKHGDCQLLDSLFTSQVISRINRNLCMFIYPVSNQLILIVIVTGPIFRFWIWLPSFSVHLKDSSPGSYCWW